MLPKDACGIIHTHPRQKPGPPSDCQGCDEDVARGRKWPIYTVHPTGIWKFDPATGQTTQEEGSGWHDNFKKTCPKKPCKGL